MFNLNREGIVSGFLIDPTKQSRAANDTSKDFSENINKRSSLSGPLIRGPVSTRSGREHIVPLMVPTKANLSKLSGLVAARTASSEDQQEKTGSSRIDTINHVCRFPGSDYEGRSKRKQDQKHHTQRVAYSRPVDDDRACTKEPSLVSFVANNIDCSFTLFMFHLLFCYTASACYFSIINGYLTSICTYIHMCTHIIGFVDEHLFRADFLLFVYLCLYFGYQKILFLFVVLRLGSYTP